MQNLPEDSSLSDKPATENQARLSISVPFENNEFTPDSQLTIEVNDHDSSRIWSNEEELLLQEIINQVRIALKNVQNRTHLTALNTEINLLKSQLESTRLRFEKFVTLIHSVQQLFNFRIDINQVCNQAINYIKDFIQFQHASIYLIHNNTITLISEQQIDLIEETVYEDKFLPLSIEDNAFLQKISQTHDPIIFSYPKEAEYINSLKISAKLASWMIVPILLDQNINGILVIGNYEPDFYQQDMYETMHPVAALLSIALNHKLLQEDKQKTTENENIYLIAAKELNAAVTYDQVLKILMKCSILGNQLLSSVSLNLFDHPWTDQKPAWMIPIARWTRTPGGFQGQKYPIDGWSGLDILFSPDKIVYIENTSNHPNLRNMGTKSLIFAPLHVAGQWIGHIIGIFSSITSFTQKEIQQLMVLTNQAAIAIEGIRLLEEIRVQNQVAP